MNGLVKTLIKPDWDDNPKRSEIIHAANLLQIGEIQLIQLAYKGWYKKEFHEDKITTAKFYFEKVLQRAEQHYKSDISGSSNIMNFKFN